MKMRGTVLILIRVIHTILGTTEKMDDIRTVIAIHDTTSRCCNDGRGYGIANTNDGRKM